MINSAAAMVFVTGSIVGGSAATGYLYDTGHLPPKPQPASTTMGLENMIPMGDNRMTENMRGGSLQRPNYRRLMGSRSGPSFIVPPAWLFNWSKRQGNSITNRTKGERVWSV